MATRTTNTTRPGKLSLRDRLAQKRSRTTSVRFPIGEQGRRAEAEYVEAEQAVKLAGLLGSKGGGKVVDSAAAEQRLRAADRKFEQHSLRLTFRGLSPSEVDALASEFTAPEGADAEFDLRGYTAALLAGAVVEENNLTAGEWDAELYESGRWSKGEVDAIRQAATAAYQEAPAPGIPKD